MSGVFGDALYYMRHDMAMLSLEELARRMGLPVARLQALENGDISAPFTETEERLFYSVVGDEVDRLSRRPGQFTPELN